VRTPGAIARTRSTGARLADLVRTLEAAEIGAFARTRACHEEAHAFGIRLSHRPAGGKCGESTEGGDQRSLFHGCLLDVVGSGSIIRLRSRSEPSPARGAATRLPRRFFPKQRSHATLCF